MIQLNQIKGSVPQNTSENTLLEIINSCNGDMNKINVKVSELWEGGMDDQWETILSRDEKVKLFCFFNIDKKKYCKKRKGKNGFQKQRSWSTWWLQKF